MGQFVETCDFEISVRKLMTRPYVFDVVFRNLHFLHFSLTKCVFLVCVILKITIFVVRVRNLKIQHFFQVNLFTNAISKFPFENR